MVGNLQFFKKYNNFSWCALFLRVFQCLSCHWQLVYDFFKILREKLLSRYARPSFEVRNLQRIHLAGFWIRKPDWSLRKALQRLDFEPPHPNQGACAKHPLMRIRSRILTPQRPAYCDPPHPETGPPSSTSIFRVPPLQPPHFTLAPVSPSRESPFATRARRRSESIGNST